MDQTYNVKITAVELKHLAGLYYRAGRREFVKIQLLPRVFGL